MVQLKDRLWSATHIYTVFNWEVKTGRDHDHFEVQLSDRSGRVRTFAEERKLRVEAFYGFHLQYVRYNTITIHHRYIRSNKRDKNTHVCQNLIDFDTFLYLSSDSTYDFCFNVAALQPSQYTASTTMSTQDSF